MGKMPKFTKQHYEKIARLFPDIRKTQLRKEESVFVEGKQLYYYEPISLNDLEDIFSAMFEGDNPNFDRARFLKACELKSE